MTSKYNTRRAGQNKLMSTDDFANCFYYAFSVMSVDVLSSPRNSYLLLLYIFGLRKLCGKTIREISSIVGYTSTFPSANSIVLAARHQCIFDDLYNAQFVADYKHLKAVCKPFRKRLSNADYCRKYYLKTSQKKKR